MPVLLIACPEGKVDFYALAPRMLHTARMARWAATQTPITFIAFDLLHLDGWDLTPLPHIERSRRLDFVGPSMCLADGSSPLLSMSTRCAAAFRSGRTRGAGPTRRFGVHGASRHAWSQKSSS
jgi:ATP-dependent DNA ligase